MNRQRPDAIQDSIQHPDRRHDTTESPPVSSASPTRDPAQDHARDAALVVRLCSGDSDAFTVLFRAYYARLVRFLIRYVATHDTAEDVAQDVFTQLWDTRATLDPHRSLRAYLFTLARNRALNILAHESIVRHHEAQTAHVQEGSPDAPTAPAADALVLADELARTAAARIATLSPRLQEIYHLSRDEGLSPKEIAELLGIAVATVHVQLAKIVQALYPAVAPWVKE